MNPEMRMKCVEKCNKGVTVKRVKYNDLSCFNELTPLLKRDEEPDKRMQVVAKMKPKKKVKVPSKNVPAKKTKKSRK